MTTSNQFSKIFSKLHFSGKRIDVIRDPYKTWLWSCLLFGVLLISVIAYDFYISHELQNGTLVTTATQSQAPAPIINEALLTQTTQVYGARAAALAKLETSGVATGGVVDPSQ